MGDILTIVSLILRDNEEVKLINFIDTKTTGHYRQRFFDWDWVINSKHQHISLTDLSIASFNMYNMCKGLGLAL